MLLVPVTSLPHPVIVFPVLALRVGDPSVPDRQEWGRDTTGVTILGHWLTFGLLLRSVDKNPVTFRAFFLA